MVTTLANDDKFQLYTQLSDAVAIEVVSEVVNPGFILKIAKYQSNLNTKRFQV